MRSKTAGVRTCEPASTTACPVTGRRSSAYVVRRALLIADDDSMSMIESHACSGDKSPDGWMPIGHADKQGRVAKTFSEAGYYVSRALRWAKLRGLAEVKTRPLRVRLP